MVSPTAQDVAVHFVKIVGARQNIDMRVRQTEEAIQKLVNQGWSLQEIIRELDQLDENSRRNVYHIEEVFCHKKPTRNLIEKDVFYYHSALRETSPPTRLYYNKETRSFERKEEKFYLQMKTAFTMDDLLEYWYTVHEIDDRNYKWDEGKFKYLLGLYTLDEILFAIDIAKTMRKELCQRPLRDAFELKNYMEEAREFIRYKQNAHKLEGINKVIRRSAT